MIMKKLFWTFRAALPLLLLAAFSFAAAEEDWKAFVGAEKVRLLDSIPALPASFYVSPDGNDAWSGRLAAPGADGTDGPFRTLERARDAVRRYRASGEFDGKPTVIELRPGLYSVEKTLELTAADSGTAEAPVVWRGVRDENGQPLAVIRGGAAVTGGKAVDDEAALARLKPEVRQKVLQFDLRALGLADYGTLDGANPAELFAGGRPMTVARYPNEGFLTLPRVEEEGNEIRLDQGNRGVVIPKLYLDDCDMTPWTREPEIWAFGYWFWDWECSRQKIVGIDPDRKLFELGKPYHAFGYRPGQYFYVYHALCELDSPGEYYIDGDAGKLYFYPPEGIDGGNLYITTLGSFIRGTELKHTVFSGLDFEGCRREGIVFTGSDLLVCGCRIRNTGGNGLTADGDRNFFFGNHIENIGGHGMIVSSGDQAALRTGRSALVNNDIHHFARLQRVYAPAIRLSGCGDLIAQNRISNAPHAGILFGGNEQRIERNEIYRVCEESNDVGAIYTGGNWTMRGNTIRQNYIHDLSGFRGYWCVGVYLDDMFSSAEIAENLFVNLKIPVMIGGGRDNSVVNNLFLDCKWWIDLDARALGWAHGAADSWLAEIAEKGTISGVDYRSPLWAGKYPRLAAITEGTPKAPEGNLIERNLVISTRNGNQHPALYEGDRIRDEARPYITLRDNVRGDLRLLLEMTRGESAVLPGTESVFQRIPVEKIGLFKGYGAVSR